MEQAIDGFLRHLKIEKNSSPLTVKSYAEDVASLIDYFQDRVGYIPEAKQVSVGMLRGYVAYLYECDYAKTTVARRVADRLGLEHVELDALAHQPGWTMRPAEEFRSDLERRLSGAEHPSRVHAG